MITRTPAKFAVFTVFALAATLTPRLAIARIYFAFDLDSLVYYSTAIVEAEVIDSGDPAKSPSAVKITRVLSGDLKENQTVPSLALSGYEKPTDQPLISTPLDGGDRVILFLFTGRHPFTNPGTVAEQLTLLPGGVRLVTDKGVAAFFPDTEPGPAIAQTALLNKTPLPTLEEFRISIAEKLRYAKETKPRLEDALATKDPTKLLALLKDRADRTVGKFDRADVIADQIGHVIETLLNPALADQAADIEGLHGQGYLNRCFGTVLGHRYLLAKLNDRKLSAEARVRYARLVEHAAPVVTAPYIEYVPHVAAIVANPATEPNVRKVLLNSMNWYISEPSFSITSDLSAAAAVLQKFHAQAKEEPLLFALECTIQRYDPATYAALKSPCGPILSLITPLQRRVQLPSRIDATVVAFQFDYRNFLPDPESRARITMVLQPTVPDRSVEVSCVWQILPPRSSNSALTGSDQVELPPELPKGRYRIFTRFYLQEKIIAESHGFEFDH